MGHRTMHSWGPFLWTGEISFFAVPGPRRQQPRSSQMSSRGYGGRCVVSFSLSLNLFIFFLFYLYIFLFLVRSKFFV